ncbi:MAG: 6-carboxytetrahydropterin synthase QueD [Elusimicrobia bacterium]|nr:6-carboxytetrahydropterin synthase QueD [Elusimicrobiota bacterium]
MFKIVREIQFCYGHRLMNYAGKCRHPHGHNGRVEVELSARELDKRGMVVDFEEIKKRLQSWIDENLDHRMLLHRKDPLVNVLKKMREPFYLLEDNPTAENIAREIYRVAGEKRLPVVRVTVWETEKSSATYQEG